MLGSALWTMLKNTRDDYGARSYIQNHFPGTMIGANVVIKGIFKNLKLGRNVQIQSGCFIHLGGLQWCEQSGSLEIGDDSVLGSNSVIYAGGKGGVRIGKRFDGGPGIGIFSTRTDYLVKTQSYVFKPVAIGDDVIVYANCVISPGVKIGDGAVIAANSAVLQNIPSNTLAGGSPARILREKIR